MNGKWFIASIPSSPSVSFGSYYIIVSTDTKRVILYGGCNVHFSSFTLADNKISFSPAMSTRKACEIDNDHLIAIPLFEQSRYGEIFEGSLLLYDDKYKMTAQFSSEPQK